MLAAMLGLSVVSLALSGSAAAQAPEEKVLNVYNWSDYISEDTIKNFEKETGIKVRYDVFDTNEILHAKLVARKTGYDIVVPSDTFAGLQIQGGLFMKLDKSKLPNLVNMDPIVQSALSKLDPNNDHLVNWLWGYTTVGINTKKVKAALGDMPMPKNAWDLIFDPKYASKLASCGISFMDSGNEVLPAALVYVGKKAYTQNPADFKEAGAMLQKVRPYIRLFSSSSYINDLANGGLCAVMGWSGDINIARHRAIAAKNGNDIQALIPSTTAVLFFDSMAIPTDAPHPNNALIWMNYIMRPEVHASLTNKVFYANPNINSLKYVTKEVVENKTVFLTEEDKKRMTPPEPVSGLIRKVEARTFTQFKTGL
ncbi:polyamine ABC transporter substrate-binding protein [Sapientia aquatica]|uniref:Putrescine-binding periplasmic protein n=2 Tax=Sapientia aquatica TaxID=1549640 RepID=A0A4R5VUG2_9BURK|nr:polyamine ABC transporter substrate-binding protein [Sapientia aquatica]